MIKLRNYFLLFKKNSNLSYYCWFYCEHSDSLCSRYFLSDHLNDLYHWKVYHWIDLNYLRLCSSHWTDDQSGRVLLDSGLFQDLESRTGLFLLLQVYSGWTLVPPFSHGQVLVYFSTHIYAIRIYTRFTHAHATLSGFCNEIFINFKKVLKHRGTSLRWKLFH